jgi:hypothetical protein
MAHTKRTRKTRKLPISPARRAAATAPTGAAVGRGATLALFATLALSLATAIASAAWLISTHEDIGMTATTMPNAQAAATGVAAPPTAAASAAPTTATATATASASLTDTANVTATTSGTRPMTQQPAAPSAPASTSGAGQRAFIDPVTGELRQPEHEELAAIAASAAVAPAGRLARSATTTNTAQLFGPDGSVAAVVPEDLHTFTVATRGPDGRINIEHAQGAASATRLMKANTAKKRPHTSVSRAQQKEDRNDR